MELYRQVRGPNDPDTLTTMKDLAVLYYYDFGDPARAEPLVRQALDGFRLIHGPDAPSVIDATFHLALIIDDPGRREESERMMTENYNHGLRALGPVALPTAVSRVSTIWQLNNHGDYTAAEQQASEALALYRQKIGESHAITHQAAWVLCEVYKNTGRFDELDRLAREWRDIGRRVFGDQGEHPLRFTQYLAIADARRGRSAEAIRLLEHVYSAQVRNLGPSSPRAIEAARYLASCYVEDRRIADAIPLFERIVEADRKNGAGTPGFAGMLAELSRQLLAHGQFATAEPYLRECLVIREKTQPDVWNTFNTKSMLGGSLLGQKKFAEAEPLLLAGYEGMKHREKTIPKPGMPRLPESLDRLIELSTATNKPDEMKKWQAERAKYPEAKPEGKK